VAIASSLSSSMSLLQKGLNLVRSSATLEHVSYSGYSLILKLGLAFTKHRDMCLQFLRHCADYRDNVVAFHAAPTVSPVPSPVPVVESLDLRERGNGGMRPQFETSVSAETSTRVKGPFSYQFTHFNDSR
jgi:hypothetical protein